MNVFFLDTFIKKFWRGTLVSLVSQKMYLSLITINSNLKGYVTALPNRNNKSYEIEFG